MNRSRRQFIGELVTGLGAIWVSPSFGWAARSLGPPRSPDEPSLWVGETDGKHVYGLYFPSGKRVQIELSDSAHSLIRNPFDRDRLFAIGKQTQSCFEVSAAQGIVTAHWGPTGLKQFYGHAVVDEKNRRILCTENDLKSGQGSIGIYRLDDKRREGEIGVGGAGPHEIVADPSGKFWVVAFGGSYNRGADLIRSGFGGVSWIARDTLKVIRTELIPIYDQNLGHLAFWNDRQLVAVSRDTSVGMKKGALVFGTDPKGKLRLLEVPSEIQSKLAVENLSVACGRVSRRNLAVVTNPGSGRVLIFDLDKLRFEAALEVPKPNGVTYLPSERSFLVSADRGKLFALKEAPYRLEAGALGGELGSGPHLALLK